MTEQNLNSALAELEFHKAVFDALTANIAIVDASGKILAVNKSWQQFGEANGLTRGTFGVGANYLDVCKTSFVDPDAREAMSGIQSVLNGEFPSYYLEYPCHSPWEERWFALRATPLENYPQIIVLAHEDITARIIAAWSNGE